MKQAPSGNTVMDLTNKFMLTSSVLNTKSSGRTGIARLNEIIAGVSEIVEENSSTSIRHHNQRLSISGTLFNDF